MNNEKSVAEIEIEEILEIMSNEIDKSCVDYKTATLLIEKGYKVLAKCGSLRISRDKLDEKYKLLKNKK